MRAGLLLGLLSLACACGKPPPARAVAGATAQPLTLAEKKARLPPVAQLPCFDCHQLAAYESGPRFPHTADTHLDLGHCHRCHRTGGHHGTMVDTAPCKECHDEIPNRAQPIPASGEGP